MIGRPAAIYRRLFTLALAGSSTCGEVGFIPTREDNPIAHAQATVGHVTSLKTEIVHPRNG